MSKYYLWEECIKQIENNLIDKATVFIIETAEKFGVEKELIEKIMNVDMSAYQSEIKKQIKNELNKNNSNLHAICLYYSLDNNWSSLLYLCENYKEDDDLEWLDDAFDEVYIKIECPELGTIYRDEAQSGFFTDERNIGICLLLMLKSTAEFYRTCQDIEDDSIVMTITCTESDVVRVK